MALCCDRCGVKPSEFDRDEDGTRLTEMQPAFGITALLCMECRKVWYKIIHVDQVFKDYQSVMFEMDFWRTQHRRRGNVKLEEGKALLAKMNSLEEKGCAVLENLIKNGISRQERRKREMQDPEGERRECRLEDDIDVADREID